MTEIGQKVISLIRAKAAENPDFMYPVYAYPDGDGCVNGCVYVWGGKPSCLVGHGLWDAGLIDASFETAGPAPGIRGPNHEPARVVIDRLGLELSGPERDWIVQVQVAQDEGVPWGDAVRKADESVVL